MQPHVFPRLAVVLALLVAGVSPANGAREVEVEAALKHAVTHAKVRAALLDKLGSDGLRIDVDLHGTRATLTGAVEKRSSVELAKAAALSVEGVSEVDDRLTLRPPSSSNPGKLIEGELANAVLESKVKGRLLAEIGANALKIEVEAADGVVRLRGVVPSVEVRRLAVEKARGTTGVRKVVNLLESQPANATAAAPAARGSSRSRRRPRRRRPRARP